MRSKTKLKYEVHACPCNEVTCMVYKCIVCSMNFGMDLVYKTGMYAFCSEKCYTAFRKMPTEKQREL